MSTSTHNTLTMSSTLSGSHYASHIQLAERHTTAWMEVSVYRALRGGVPVSRAASCVAATSGKGLVQEGLVNSEDLTATFRLTFELWPNESPKTVENFLNLCLGKTTSRLPLVYEGEPIATTYQGTVFHKIVPGFIAQGGDLTRLVNGGANHFSSFGKPFEDENMKHVFDQKGLLAMANNGPNSNGSQFFITTGVKDEKALTSRHCCFGRVTSGLEAFLEHVAPFGNDRGEAQRFVVVTACGAS